MSIGRLAFLPTPVPSNCFWAVSYPRKPKLLSLHSKSEFTEKNNCMLTSLLFKNKRQLAIWVGRQ